MKIEKLAAEVLQILGQKGLTLATAESCTGGGIGHALTAVPGSSSVYLGGVISYANSVKERLLGVPKQVLDTVGAVSEETASQMARGVCETVGADVGVSVTGIAGPASDDTNKPVGLVFIGVCVDGEVHVMEHHFSGSREEVRACSVERALRLILETIA